MTGHIYENWMKIIFWNELRVILYSSRCSDWLRGGEIYMAVCGSHFFYDLFSQGWGDMAPVAPWIHYCCTKHGKACIFTMYPVHYIFGSYAQ